MSVAAARSFAPVADPRARILVLGSLPGARSLQLQQYYGLPRNAFWRIVAAVTGVPADADYAARLEGLRQRGIALWDVIASAQRPGSLDAAIRAATRAEAARVHRAAPKVAVVCFNGRTAARAAPVWREAGYATLVLPSTSPAYTRPFAEKLAAWRALADHLPARPRGPGPA